VERDGRGWRIALESSNGLVTVKTRLLIAANGKSSRLVGELGACRRTDSRLVCSWIADSEAGLPPGLTQIEAEEEGW